MTGLHDTLEDTLEKFLQDMRGSVEPKPATPSMSRGLSWEEIKSGLTTGGVFNPITIVIEDKSTRDAVRRRIYRVIAQRSPRLYKVYERGNTLVIRRDDIPLETV